uniref:Uncharacterized protein n=1 Tax=Anolis carolinensis TaxID=28377 RepID=A0A803TZ84_ANOCA
STRNKNHSTPEQRGLCDFHNVKVVSPLVLKSTTSPSAAAAVGNTLVRHSTWKTFTRNWPQTSQPCRDLTGWAKQGMPLLGSTRPVPSHQEKGWESFTGAMSPVSTRSMEARSFSFGAPRPAGREDASMEWHVVLEVAPRDEDQGFLGRRHFSWANALLRASGKESIPWAAPMNPWPGFSRLFLHYVP